MNTTNTDRSAAARELLDFYAAAGVDAVVGEHVRWCGPAPEGTVSLRAQLRAHGEEYAAMARADGDEVHVRLAERVRGVAAGQSVVLYDGTRVVGSATIRQAYRARVPA